MMVAFGFSLSIFLLLPKFLKTELAAGAFEIGLVSSMFGAASVVAVPFAGAWVSRYGCRRSIMAGNLALGVGALGFVLVTTVGPLALLSRSMHGLAWNMVFSAGMTLATMITPADRMAEAIGVYGSANILTNALAPALAEPLIDRVGYRPVFAASAIIAVVAWALGRRLVEPSADRSAAAQPTQSIQALLRRPRYQRLLVVGLVSGLGFGVIFTFHQPFALALGMRNVSGFFIAYSVGALGIRLAAGRLMDRAGHQRSARMALVLSGLVVASTAALRPGWLAVVGGSFGIAHGFFYPAVMALAVDSRSGQRAQPLMLMSGAFAAGSAFVPLFGALADAAGYPPVFIIAGTASALAAVLIPPPA